MILYVKNTFKIWIKYHEIVLTIQPDKVNGIFNIQNENSFDIFQYIRIFILFYKKVCCC